MQNYLLQLEAISADGDDFIRYKCTVNVSCPLRMKR